MKHFDLVRLYASQTRLPDARAADELNQAISHILSNLRKGEAVRLPGLGVLRSDPKLGIEFLPSPKPSRR